MTRIPTGFDATLKELQNTSEFSKYLPFALAALRASGVLRALRERARPETVPATSDNCVAAQAFEAQRSIGYNECIDDLIYFTERYLKTTEHADTPMLDYGARQAIVDAGDLTKEELDAVIAGGDPNDIYAKLYAKRAGTPTGVESGAGAK